MFKQKLQIITKNNSDSLSVLFHSFENQFPEEKALIVLLRKKIFLDSSISDTLVIEKLEQLQNRKV